MKPHTAPTVLWPLGVAVLTVVILAAGLLAVLGTLALGAGRRIRWARRKPHQSPGLGRVAHLGGPRTEVILSPPAEATFSRAA